MQMKIHNLKEYSPAEIEAFRQRMEARRNLQEEYREAMSSTRMLGTVILFFLGLAVVGTIIFFCWQSSDRLVGLVGS